MRPHPSLTRGLLRVPIRKGRSIYYACAHHIHRIQVVQTGLVHRNEDRWRTGLRILCYHRISNDDDELAVTPHDFRAQMTLMLHAGAMPESLDGALGQVEASVSGRHVCVTFDDGYHDNVDYALPILRELGIPATIFVASAVIDGAAPLYWYDRAPAMLSWGELREVSQEDQFAIGAHSRTHPALHRLSDENAWDEIAGSRRDLEERLQTPVTSFAYPSGLYGEREIRMVARAGYRAGLTCEPGLNGPYCRPHALRRTLIDRSDSLTMFEAKLMGLLDRPWGIRKVLAVTTGRRQHRTNR